MGIAKLCEMLNMPFNMSLSTWYDHEEALSMAHEEVKQEQLAKNRAEARLQAVQEEGINDANDQMIISIPGSFDGSWLKRGYTANNCVGFFYFCCNWQCWTLKLFQKPVVCAHKRSQV